MFGGAVADYLMDIHGNDLLVTNLNTSEKLQVQNWFYSYDYQLETISFGDGTVVTAAQVNQFADDYLLWQSVG
jgi:hypothetical protein